jgi:hypothetical protein
MLSKRGFGPQAEPESTLGTPDALGESMAAKMRQPRPYLRRAQTKHDSDLICDRRKGTSIYLDPTATSPFGPWFSVSVSTLRQQGGGAPRSEAVPAPSGWIAR